MMVEFRWIQIWFLLTMVLQIAAAGGEKLSLYFTVREGDEVTLPCENGINGGCDGTTWLLSRSEKAVPLIEHGQIHKDAQSKSDRLILTASCSLVIKKVTAEDAGRYTCRQFESGHQQGPDAQVYLSVVTMTEQKDADTVTLSCSVSTYERCEHTVKWLYENMDQDNNRIMTSQSTCSATVTFKTSQNIYTLKCNVTHSHTRNVQLFIFKPQSSGKETVTTDGQDSGTIGTMGKFRWWYILVAVGVAALLITVVAFVMWRRSKANKAWMDDNVELTSNPAVSQSAPEVSQADPEDGVSYATISHTKKSQAWIRGGDEAVTYSTVKAPSSSTGADLSNFYATVNNPRR